VNAAHAFHDKVNILCHVDFLASVAATATTKGVSCLTLNIRAKNSKFYETHYILVEAPYRKLTPCASLEHSRNIH